MSNIKPSFEQAINAAQLWCYSWDNEEISDEVLAQRVGELIETNEGARGFFVISLSSDSPLMDRLPDVLIYKLREKGEFIVDLTVKNLAMSSAMAFQHKENKNSQHQVKSERIKKRCIGLLRELDTQLVKYRLEILLNALNNKGSDVSFLNRWGYKKDQKLAIKDSIFEIAQN